MHCLTTEHFLRKSKSIQMDCRWNRPVMTYLSRYFISFSTNKRCYGLTNCAMDKFLDCAIRWSVSRPSSYPGLWTLPRTAKKLHVMLWREQCSVWQFDNSSKNFTFILGYTLVSALLKDGLHQIVLPFHPMATGLCNVPITVQSCLLAVFAHFGPQQLLPLSGPLCGRRTVRGSEPQHARRSHVQNWGTRWYCRRPSQLLNSDSVCTIYRQTRQVIHTL
jgi:hypothetical protein